MGCMLRSSGIILLRKPIVYERLITPKGFASYRNTIINWIMLSHNIVNNNDFTNLE